jgi:hypothetical protein
MSAALGILAGEPRGDLLHLPVPVARLRVERDRPRRWLPRDRRGATVLHQSTASCQFGIAPPGHGARHRVSSAIPRIASPHADQY